MNPNQIFFTSDGSRLRAGWRLLIQTVSLILFGSCLIVPLFTVLFLLDPSLLSSLLSLRPEYLLLVTVAEAIAVTASVFLSRRLIDRQPIESLGLKLNIQALIDVLAGIGIAFLQMGFVYVLMLGLGWLTFEGFAWEFDPLGTVITGVLLFLAIFILVGWSEDQFRADEAAPAAVAAASVQPQASNRTAKSDRLPSLDVIDHQRAAAGSVGLQLASLQPPDMPRDEAALALTVKPLAFAPPVQPIEPAPQVTRPGVSVRYEMKSMSSNCLAATRMSAVAVCTSRMTVP